VRRVLEIQPQTIWTYTSETELQYNDIFIKKKKNTLGDYPLTVFNVKMSTKSKIAIEMTSIGANNVQFYTKMNYQNPNLFRLEPKKGRREN